MLKTDSQEKGLAQPGDRERTITTLCRMCEQGCGLEVTLGPNGPLRVRGDRHHPYSRGWLCVKGMAALDFLSSPRRITTPSSARTTGGFAGPRGRRPWTGRPANCTASGRPTVPRAWPSITGGGGAPGDQVLYETVCQRLRHAELHGGRVDLQRRPDHGRHPHAGQVTRPDIPHTVS